MGNAHKKSLPGLSVAIVPLRTGTNLVMRQTQCAPRGEDVVGNIERGGRRLGKDSLVRTDSLSEAGAHGGAAVDKGGERLKGSSLDSVRIKHGS